MKKHRWSTAIPIVITFCAVTGVGFIWYFKSLFGECRTDVRKSISSPDAKNVVVVFGKECNATVGFNTQLSIAPAGSAFSAERYPAFFVTSGLHVVQATWRDNGAVEITLIPGGGKIFRNEERAGSIRVIYP